MSFCTFLDDKAIKALASTPVHSYQPFFVDIAQQPQQGTGGIRLWPDNVQVGYVKYSELPEDMQGYVSPQRLESFAVVVSDQRDRYPSLWESSEVLPQQGKVFFNSLKSGSAREYFNADVLVRPDSSVSVSLDAEDDSSPWILTDTISLPKDVQSFFSVIPLSDDVMLVRLHAGIVRVMGESEDSVKFLARGVVDDFVQQVQDSALFMTVGFSEIPGVPQKVSRAGVREPMFLTLGTSWELSPRGSVQSSSRVVMEASLLVDGGRAVAEQDQQEHDNAERAQQIREFMASRSEGYGSEVSVKQSQSKSLSKARRVRTTRPQSSFKVNNLMQALS